MSAARSSTLREVSLAAAVEQADAQRDREYHDCHERADGDTVRGSIYELERSMRDVDSDDVEAYLVHDDTMTLREYLQGVADLQYEKGERWPN